MQSKALTLVGWRDKDGKTGEENKGKILNKVRRVSNICYTYLQMFCIQNTFNEC